jgi:hypothetical protein
MIQSVLNARALIVQQLPRRAESMDYSRPTRWRASSVQATDGDTTRGRERLETRGDYKAGESREAGAFMSDRRISQLVMRPHGYVAD